MVEYGMSAEGAAQVIRMIGFSVGALQFRIPYPELTLGATLLRLFEAHRCMSHAPRALYNRT